MDLLVVILIDFSTVKFVYLQRVGIWHSYPKTFVKDLYLLSGT